MGTLTSRAPQTRSKSKTVAQKTVNTDVQKDLPEFTPLKSLFVDGMDDEQIWAQLDLRTKTVCKFLDFVLEGVSEEHAEEGMESTEDEMDFDGDAEKLRQALAALKGDEDVDMDELAAKYGLSFDDDSEETSGDEEDEDTGSDSQSDDGEEEEEAEEGISRLRDHDLEEEGNDQLGSKLLNRIAKASPKKKGKSSTSELDDDFFNLAEFNADTERAEAKSSSRGRLSGDDDSDDDDMDIDLFAAVDGNQFDEEDEGEGEGMFPFLFSICPR